MKNCNFHNKKFFGTATVGEKGQVVIPAEARESMRLKKGDKLLAFGVGDGIFALVKIDSLESLAAHLNQELSGIKDVLKNTKTIKK